MQLTSREWGRSELREWGRTEQPRMSANGAERMWQNRSRENKGAQSRETRGEWRRENEAERSCDWRDKLLGFCCCWDLLCGQIGIWICCCVVPVLCRFRFCQRRATWVGKWCCELACMWCSKNKRVIFLLKLAQNAPFYAKHNFVRTSFSLFLCPYKFKTLWSSDFNAMLIHTENTQGEEQGSSCWLHRESKEWFSNCCCFILCSCYRLRQITL